LWGEGDFVIKLLKIRVLALLFLTLIFRVSFAQSDCPPEFALPKADQFKSLQKASTDHGFLWKVTKDGKTSHLFGTIHIGKVDWMFPGPMVVNALSQSKKLAVELNFDDPEVRKVMLDLALSKSESKLSNELNERIKRYALKNCVKYESLLNLRPEIQLMTLGALSLRKEKIYPELGIDMALMGIASAMRKTIVGLETPQEQMSVIFSKPDELEQDIKEALSKLEDGLDDEMLSKVVNSWVGKDFDILNNYADWCKCLDTQKDRDEMKRSIDDRNVLMVNRFHEIHADGGQILMAVGSLHMVGPMGIPTLLKNRGYTVERLH
jgi:uncharacterized protein